MTGNVNNNISSQDSIRKFPVTFGTGLHQASGTVTDRRYLSWDDLKTILTKHEEGAYSDDSALLFRRKAPGFSEGKRPMIPKDCAPLFQLIAPGCSGRIGA